MSTEADAPRGPRQISDSLREYGRGIAGGLIFSLPLLYTAEVWESGFIMHPWRLLLGIGITMLLLIGYNRYAGLRRDASLSEVLIDSVEELGLGLLVATLLLALLGRIGPELSPGIMVDSVVLGGLLAAIGVSVGTAQLGGDDRDTGSADNDKDTNGLLERSVLGACGATLIAANLAPTEEMAIIAASVQPWQLIGLMALGISLAAIISFYSDFTGSKRPHQVSTFSTLSEIALTYAVALIVAAALLWFFGHFDGKSLHSCLAQTITLSVGSALGASAGRLLLKP